ncbi:hypothetical protein GCM10010232_30230 [Streptomyces amakusaensis]|uniref:Uncharacterized protein n=1 Tax=Streptomyces amakusaensis TaxID=67271 RepID=A0ABW0AA60_9ACTN
MPFPCEVVRRFTGRAEKEIRATVPEADLPDLPDVLSAAFGRDPDGGTGTSGRTRRVHPT